MTAAVAADEDVDDADAAVAAEEVFHLARVIDDRLLYKG